MYSAPRAPCRRILHAPPDGPMGWDWISPPGAGQPVDREVSGVGIAAPTSASIRSATCWALSGNAFDVAGLADVGREHAGAAPLELAARDRALSRIGRARRGRGKLRRGRPPPLRPAHRTGSAPSARPALLGILRRPVPARDDRIGWRLTSAVPNGPGFEYCLDATRASVPAATHRTSTGRCCARSSVGRSRRRRRGSCRPVFGNT